MKKKNLKNLMLRKETISGLNGELIRGGISGGASSRGIICSRSCNSRCLCPPPASSPGVNCTPGTRPYPTPDVSF